MIHHPRPQDRDSMVTWARDVLESNAVILDFETTDIKDAEIVQIGLIDMRGETLMETLARPNGPISPGAQRVHGITAAMVAKAPTFEALYVRLSSALAGKRVVAYNASFEKGVLAGVCERRKLPSPRIAAWDCAMINYATFYGQLRGRGYRWQSLSNACAQQRISAQGAHDALTDCRLTLDVIRAMAR